MTAWGFRNGTGMDLKGLPQTVQNFIEETIQNRENGKFPDNETCQKVMEYAADTGSQKLAGLGLYYLAEYYWQNDQYENTLQCLTESIGYLKNEQMYELLARTYNMMGAVSDRKNNRMVALSSYYNCLQYAEKYHFYYIQGMAESNIAYTLVRMRLRQEAIQHYRTAIDFYSKSEKTYQLNYNRINCMIECGCCHMYMGEMEEALRLWNQIEQIIREAPESYYSKITLEMYRISCELLQGHEEEALKLAADLLEQLSDRDVFEEIMDELVILAGILAILPDGKYLEELIRNGTPCTIFMIDIDEFKKIINESGRSSYMYNQNVFTPKDPAEQKISLALCISEEVLGVNGAYRVHGGGFAGTIQAFVPNELLQEYKTAMEDVFGKGSCHVLIIRPVGGTRVL